jgi:DNA repair helicase Rad3
MNCEICYFDFDNSVHEPRLLKCGHTYCSFCLTSLLQNGMVKCPVDKIQSGPIASATDLPKNFHLIKSLSSINDERKEMESKIMKQLQSQILELSLRNNQSISLTLLEYLPIGGDIVTLNENLKNQPFVCMETKEGQNLRRVNISKTKAKFSAICPDTAYGQYAKMPYQPYDYQKGVIKALIDAICDKKKIIALESPTGSGKTQMIITSLFSYLSKVKEPVRIFYFTRTISQVSHVIKEAKMSAYDFDGTLFVSRKNVCPVSKVANSKNPNDMSRACFKHRNGNGCQYFEKNANLKQSNKDDLPDIIDIEDMKGLTEKGYCSYFLSREKVENTSNFVSLSYFYLLNKVMLKQIDIKNNIIVIDEAHNALKLFKKFFSFTLNPSKFKMVLEEIVEITEDFFLEDQVAIASSRAELEKIGLIIQNLNIMKAEYTNTYARGGQLKKIFALDSDPINLEFLNTLIRVSDSKNDVAKDESIVSNISINEEISTENLRQFITKLTKIHSLYAKNINFDDHFWISFESKIKVCCLNGQLGMQHILEQNPRNVIFSSATFSPIDVYEKGLGASFDAHISPNKSLLKPFYESKLNTYIVKNTQQFGGSQLYLNYEAYKSDYLIKSILKLIFDLGNSIDNGGILIFISSYSVMAKFQKVFSTYFSVDNNNNSEFMFESQFQGFEQQIQKFENFCKTKRSFFFMVIDGKFSEGLDFKDDKGRLAFIVGVPYENINSERVKIQKMILSKTEFWTWYQKETMIKVNQAAGRIKRSDEDWGAVFLLDTRYELPELSSHLSPFLRDSVKAIDSYDKLRDDVKTFCSRQKGEEGSIFDW